LGQTDTIPKPKSFGVEGFRIGLGITPLSYSILKQEYLGYSGSAELIFKRGWVAVFDVGVADYSYAGLSGRHNLQAKGQFFSFGFDYNLLNSREDMALVGLRFGRSNFSQHVQYTSSDTIWGGQNTFSLESKGLSANWLELAAGLRVRLFGNFYLANSLKVKARISKTEPEEMSLFSIPGYGSAGVAAKGSLELSLMYFIWKKRKNSHSNNR
jgi:hypothetical protein